MVFGLCGPRPDFAAAALWIEHGRSLHAPPWGLGDENVRSKGCQRMSDCFRHHFGERYRHRPWLPRRHQKYASIFSSIALDDILDRFTVLL